MASAVPEVARRDGVRAGHARGGLLAALRRMLERRSDRDGQAPALEAAAEPGPQPSPGGDGPRDLRFELPQEIIDRALAQKVLHAWSKNRYYTRTAETFRLNRLAPEERGLPMRFAAAAFLATSAAGDEARRSTEDRLRAAKADEGAIEVFRDAVGVPEALGPLIAAVRSRQGNRELVSLAYAATVLASDLREPAGQSFAKLIAARLGLSADAVREAHSIYGGSADRIHRR